MFATWEALVVADILEFEGVLERAVAIATFSRYESTTTSTTYTEWFITNLNLFQFLMHVIGRNFQKERFDVSTIIHYFFLETLYINEFWNIVVTWHVYLYIVRRFLSNSCHAPNALERWKQNVHSRRLRLINWSGWSA